MSPHQLQLAKEVVRKSLQRMVVAFVAVQGVVIAGLVLVDAIKKHARTKRSRFPRPGTFSSEVADSVTTIYTYGEDLYEAMLEEIGKAKHRILIETYIWKGDSLGQRFKDALGAAAERGVEVYAVYDGFANLVVPASFYKFHPAIHLMRFPVLRPSILIANVRGTGLDHRKMLIIDDHTGFVGGYNIGLLYATQWRDTHLKIVGPSVWELHQAFATVWNGNRKQQPGIEELDAGIWEPRIRAVNNIPANLVYPIRGVYLDAINRASHHIYITMAYFIPDHQILTALFRASKRGVDVRVILPENSNHVLADWLSRGFYTALLRGGVTILLYQNAMVHAKTATVDGEWSTVGTANIDRLSLTGNYEINMEIHDRNLAEDMEKIFEVDSTNSRELTLAEWESRQLVARFSEAVLAPLRPLL
ncbi:phosphatidylserine/phosphatidylglycerophosphate/cardiolipin synthase family protein [Paenarthrobacter sp. Z7-10]|uniref:phospholipase D-like domain-containing protein n=1 Tax=Paenarthrobacter sp. Z7-10 TaxID=2787635 RepID=UPI0022A8E752|nr:phospholipase D-like domain-containing protein [Paenarthrobacter sp. Z7-10]MCZ2402188.1 phosphatidylserine/phosphatidylglycerophosphate/cardiolipin synthase family protein [Paenarthrobacter sp. Z7-10]